MQNLLTANEVAKILKCSRGNVMNLFKKGILRGIVINTSIKKPHVRFTEKNINDWIQSQQVEIDPRQYG